MSSNFVRFQEILNQALAENFTCLTQKLANPLKHLALNFIIGIHFLNKYREFPINVLKLPWKSLDVAPKLLEFALKIPAKLAVTLLRGYLIIQWIFDLRKFLGTAKNFLKSKIFLKSNTPSSLKYANWKYYIYFYDPIY